MIIYVHISYLMYYIQQINLYNCVMKRQNLNKMQTQTIKLSITSAQIIIKQPPYIYPLNAPFLFQRASQPLILNQFQIKQFLSLDVSRKDKQNQILRFKVDSKKQSSDLSPSIFQQLKQDKKIQINVQNKIHSFIQENLNYKKQISQLKILLQQQKQKYNQLKNLYKEGQIIFSMLQDRKINLQRQCKQLKQQLDNLKSSEFGEKSRQSYIPKIRTIKVSNNQIPIIKVTVPPQIFWHSNNDKIQNKPYQQIGYKQINEIINDHTTNNVYNISDYPFFQKPNIENSFKKNMNQAIAQIRQQNSDLKYKCGHLQNKLAQLTTYSQKLMFDCQSAIQKLIHQIKNQQQQIYSKQQQIQNQSQQIYSKQQQIKNQSQQIKSKQQQIQNHSQRIYSQNILISNQYQRINNLQQRIRILQQGINCVQSQKNKLYQILQNKNSQLQQIYCLSKNRGGSSLAASNNSQTSNKQMIQTKKIINFFNSKQKNT